MEAELDPDPHCEDEDDSRDGAELDAEEAESSKQLTNDAGRDEAEKEKKTVRKGNVRVKYQLTR